MFTEPRIYTEPLSVLVFIPVSVKTETNVRAISHYLKMPLTKSNVNILITHARSQRIIITENTRYFKPELIVLKIVLQLFESADVVLAIKDLWNSLGIGLTIF